MSTAKRSRRQQAEAKASAASPSQPASKRLKTAKDSHVPARNGLDFLVDEDRRQSKRLEAKLTNGVPNPKSTRLDDSQAVIAQSQNDFVKVGSTQDNALEISSAESSSSEDESEEEDDEIVVNGGVHLAAEKDIANGHVAGPVDGDNAEADAVAGAEKMDVDLDAQEATDEETGEPSFGDMLQARHPEQIDVRMAFPDPTADRQALVQSSGPGTLGLPSGTSLVTVLTQALKTNDKAQLEACFAQMDVPTIRSTVQRMQSQHVATLLQRVAERIHKRPGRTGSLLVWIQWSLVAHGAYLATQPAVMVKLRSLSQVLTDRSSGLQPLLHLKGKLDMLSAQLDMRRSMQAASRARADAEDEDDEEAVVYIEGQEDDDWSDEDGAAAASAPQNGRSIKPTSKRRQLHTPNTDAEMLSNDESDDEMPNGVMQEADDESSADEEDEEGGMLDVEAEETSNDEDDEEEDSEEQDSEPDSESDLSEEDDESDASEGVKPIDPGLLRRKR